MPQFNPRTDMFRSQLQRIGSSGSRAYQNMLNKNTAAEDRAMALEDRDLNRQATQAGIDLKTQQTEGARIENESQKRVVAGKAFGAVDTASEVPIALEYARDKLQPIMFDIISKDAPTGGTDKEVKEWANSVQDVLVGIDKSDKGKELKVFNAEGDLVAFMTPEQISTMKENKLWTEGYETEADLSRIGKEKAAGRAPKEPKIERKVPREDPDTGKNYTVDLKDGVEIEGSRVYPDEEAEGMPTSPAGLTALALEGGERGEKAQSILTKMQEDAVSRASEIGLAQTQAKLSSIDAEGTALAILEGRETIDNVRNTFGVAVQESVRKRVLAQDPKFNFNIPRATVSGVKGSLNLQFKNLGMMGSFVKNINKQVDRISEIGDDIVSRMGVRALDLPKREIVRKAVGSGNENIMEAYMKEIGAEIAKLSQGSAASVAQLPEENRKEWERIHDSNLSMRELIKVLKETKEMANMRMDSVEEQVGDTMGLLENVNKQYGAEDSIPNISSDAEYNSLPSGSEFIDPNGKKRRKP